MSAQVTAPGAGRLVRGGRVVARVLRVWALTVAALVLLDRWLVGFDMAQWWQPTVLALLFGVLSAVLWPLILRVALPRSPCSRWASAASCSSAPAMLLLSFAVPGVTITDLGTAVTVVAGLSAVGAVASSLIGLDEDELFFRRAARRAHGGTDDHDDRPPGVLFLQVDGLGDEVARRAVRDGNMPTFAAWLAAGSHRLTDWTPTGARRPAPACAASCTATTPASSATASTRRTATTWWSAATRRTPPTWSAPTPTGAGCSPWTAPGTATCSPGTPRTSA